MHPTPEKQLGRVRQSLWGIALLLLALSVYVHFVSVNATDKNWLLIAAGELLTGKQLYRDIFEINPPLILWIYAAPVWFARHLPGINEYQALALTACISIAGVIGLCTRLIGLHPAFFEQKDRQRFFALLLAYVFIFLTAPMYFFDREHILFVFTFPYMLRFSPGLARSRLSLSMRVAIGLFAAVGFCIKPHTVIVFAALQLLYMARERSGAILVSVENLILYALSALYLGFIYYCLPEYFHTVLPMALATYSAYSRKVTGIYSIVFVVVMLGVTFADFRPRHETPFRKAVYYFLGVSLAYLAYGMLNNGWAYTYQPAIGMVRFLCGWVLMEFVWLKADARARGLPEKSFIFGLRDCSINLMLNVLFYVSCFIVYFMPYNCNDTMSCRSTARFFVEAKQYHVRSFGAMSLEFYKWSELARETGEHWDTRFNHLWMLPKFLLSDADFTRRNYWIIDYVGNAYAEDLNGWKPEVVFVDDSPEIFKGHPHFDIPGYLSSVSTFREAWSHYRHTGTIDTCVKSRTEKPQGESVESDCRFDVYTRTPGP